MNPLIFLGMSIGVLAFPLGFAIGFNKGSSGELKRFNSTRDRYLGSSLKKVRDDFRSQHLG